MFHLLHSLSSKFLFFLIFFVFHQFLILFILFYNYFIFIMVNKFPFSCTFRKLKITIISFFGFYFYRFNGFWFFWGAFWADLGLNLTSRILSFISIRWIDTNFFQGLLDISLETFDLLGMDFDRVSVYLCQLLLNFVSFSVFVSLLWSLLHLSSPSFFSLGNLVLYL